MPTPWASLTAALALRSPRRDSPAIVALKPTTQGIENIAFNDFTMGVDTTAIVQAENIYEIERRLFAGSGCPWASSLGLNFTRTRSIPTPM